MFNDRQQNNWKCLIILDYEYLFVIEPCKHNHIRVKKLNTNCFPNYKIIIVDAICISYHVSTHR